MADGIIIIDKPAGWTSMDVCGKLRGILKTKKVGHAGTLDPMATGVLPVFVGHATRAVSYAESGDKEYVAGLRLGLVTNTQDTSGDVLEQHPVHISAQQLEAVLPRFTGEIEQVPPMYSAIKINGQKLYELARKGREIERPARRVTIHALELLGGGDGEFLLRVRCSKGTYVRTLCRRLHEQPAAHHGSRVHFGRLPHHRGRTGAGGSSAVPCGLPVPAVPRLPHRVGAGGAPLPLRQSAGGGEPTARAVPGLRRGRRVSVLEPLGKRGADLGEKLFRSVKKFGKNSHCAGLF